MHGETKSNGAPFKNWETMMLGRRLLIGGCPRALGLPSIRCSRRYDDTQWSEAKKCSHCYFLRLPAGTLRKHIKKARSCTWMTMKTINRGPSACVRISINQMQPTVAAPSPPAHFVINSAMIIISLVITIISLVITRISLVVITVKLMKLTCYRSSSLISVTLVDFKVLCIFIQ